MTKILFTTTLTFLIFSLFALPVSVEGKTYDEMLLKIRRNIEKIQSRMIEKPSHVTTLHPETDAEKVFLTGRVEELSGEGEVYFQWGPTEWMENKTEPQEITFRGRFAEKITGLDSRREPFFARAVLETEEGTFYGSTLSFGAHYYVSEPIELSVEAARSVYYDGRHKREVLLNKNQHKAMGIASVTKLMTALVALESYNLDDQMNIESIRLATDRRLSGIKGFEDTRIEELLHPLLLESNNANAYALAIQEGRIETFLEKMNKKASLLRMRDTHFKNPSGLDGHRGVNKSTAYDLSRLAKEIVKQPLIGDILRKENYTLEAEDADLRFQIRNTNLFLREDYFEEKPEWVERVWGGKTGWTHEAGGALIMILEEEDGRGYYINVILGARSREERFEEMKKIIEWIEENH